MENKDAETHQISLGVFGSPLGAIRPEMHTRISAVGSLELAPTKEIVYFQSEGGDECQRGGKPARQQAGRTLNNPVQRYGAGEEGLSAWTCWPASSCFRVTYRGLGRRSTAAACRRHRGVSWPRCRGWDLPVILSSSPFVAQLLSASRPQGAGGTATL